MSLSDMPNIGKVTERQLIEAGIETPEQLREIGAKEALLRIRLTSDPEACIRVLYGLQGAIDGVKDSALTETTKRDLLAFFRTL